MAQSKTPDPEADNQEADANARPEGLPDNFKDVQALASSYQELQRKLTEEAQNRSAIEQNYSDLAAQFTEYQTAQPDPNDVRSQIESMWENDPLAAVAYLVQQGVQQGLKQTEKRSEEILNPALQTQYQIIAAHADQAMSNAHEDWQGQYSEKVADAIREKPWLLPEQALNSPQATTQVLESLYKMVKADDIISGNTQAVAQSEQDRQRKLAAQSAQGSGGRQPTADEQQAEWERVKQADSKPYWANNPS